MKSFVTILFVSILSSINLFAADIMKVEVQFKSTEESLSKGNAVLDKVDAVVKYSIGRDLCIIEFEDREISCEISRGYSKGIMRYWTNAPAYFLTIDPKELIDKALPRAGAIVRAKSKKYHILMILGGGSDDHCDEPIAFFKKKLAKTSIKKSDKTMSYKLDEDNYVDIEVSQYTCPEKL